MQQMDTETARELQILRSRVYGPSADLHRDSAALRRLRELEEHVRARASTSLDDPPAGDASRRAAERELAGGADILPPDIADATAAAPDSDPSPSSGRDGPVPGPSTAQSLDPRTRRRLSWPIRLLWTASIVATAGIAASMTYGLLAVSPVAASSGAPQVATLRPAPRVEVPSGWFGAGPSSRAWEFHGLTLFETASGMYGGASSGDCFAVVPTEEIPAEEDVSNDSWSISGVAYSACRAGAFPAALEIIVDSDAPEELRVAYPDSALQFVKQGDQIGVFLDKG